MGLFVRKCGLGTDSKTVHPVQQDVLILQLNVNSKKYILKNDNENMLFTESLLKSYTGVLLTVLHR